MKFTTRMMLMTSGAALLGAAALAAMSSSVLAVPLAVKGKGLLIAGAAAGIAPAAGSGTSTNPLVSFAQGLETWFKSKEQEVVQWADNYLPEVENDLEVGLESLIEIAGGAVLKQAPLMISGAEKFGTAVNSVVQQVEASGKTIAQSTAQMAVQQAYLTAQTVAQKNKAAN